MHSGYILFIGICFTLKESYARIKCLSCNAVPQPVDCPIVEECNAHQKCYIEKYVTNGGSVMYNLGCRDLIVCPSSGLTPVGRRGLNAFESTGLQLKLGSDTSFICKQCCDNEDICNIGQHCDTPKFTPPTGTQLCYKCPVVGKLSECTQLTLCNSDSSCSAKQTKNLLGQTRWQVGCLRKSECNSQNIPGTCSYCCDNRLCNGNSQCNKSTSLPPTSTQPSTVNLPTKPIITNVVIRPDPPKYGFTVQVKCPAVGSLPISYSFQYFGLIIPSNIQIEPVVMNIRNYSRSNDGNYRCFAKNSAGVDFNSFYLHGTA